ncbi:hypothetical protein G4B88_007653 [Cannabis sativa]|uniref:AB hydrolase-1 domain-containing protein n=1 Tax=Cannabis sativa TaxID=3483 RepID=A0A7J6HE92_CANSA|nr:hypothetical protein G4B88_007653 [Cannabis sativa]
MHVAEKGQGPTILFLHGFPELWYTWRHQILTLASLGYRAVAPDLRGYGDTDAPPSVGSYTCMDVVGDVIGLLDAIAAEEEKVFVVGHDWGALIAWYLCLFRPDRVKALVNLSVEIGEIEGEFAHIGTQQVLREFFTYRNPGPLMLPKGKGFPHSKDSPTPANLPSWLTQQDLDYYTTKFHNKGFTGDVDLTYNSLGAKDYIHKGGFKKDVPLLEEVIVMEGVGHFINEERPTEISNHIYHFFKKF